MPKAVHTIVDACATEVLGRGDTDNGVTQQPRSINNSITPFTPDCQDFFAKKENAEREMQGGVPKRSLADATSSAPKMLGLSNTVENNLLRTDQASYTISIAHNLYLSTPNPNFSP